MRSEGIEEAVIHKAQDLFRDHSGADIEGQNFRGTLEAFNGRIILVGSESDEDCPLPPIRDLASALPNAQLIEDDDLGHRDLALDPGILSRISHLLAT
jgi:pimeloyl-ACP methyl ester carboxylesterase